MNKLTGSYYTPRKLAVFMWEHVLKSFRQHSKFCILEPSCGEGVFLQSTSKHKTGHAFFVDAVDVNLTAIKKAQETIKQNGERFQVSFINKDFLATSFTTKYDLIIGNPPYISRKLLSDEQKKLGQQIHVEGVLGNNKIRNIWTAFVIKSTLLLNPHGMLALVLPGELLQVSYAEKIREFLLKHFKRIEVLTFRELVFSALGQDVVVVFAYKDATSPGIYYSQIDTIDSLNSSVTFVHRTSGTKNHTIKWSNFVLDDNELDFLSTIAQRVKKVSHYCTSTPGIVTAANKFFIVNQETVDKYKLEPYCQPILQKSALAKNTVFFDTLAFQNLKESGASCFLLNLQDTAEPALPTPVRQYLQQGIEQEIPNRYKCRHREPWYNIPCVWVPEGVFFKRCHLYPKLLKNDAQVLFTDSAYCILPHQNYDISSFIYSFYNSLTLIFCELSGRFYGGGVLELTPKEFQSLPLPYKAITQTQFDEFKQFFHKSESIEKVLQYNDVALLATTELTVSDRKRLQEIHQKLLARRLRHKLKKADE